MDLNIVYENILSLDTDGYIILRSNETQSKFQYYEINSTNNMTKEVILKTAQYVRNRRCLCAIQKLSVLEILVGQ